MIFPSIKICYNVFYCPNTQNYVDLMNLPSYFSWFSQQSSFVLNVFQMFRVFSVRERRERSSPISADERRVRPDGNEEERWRSSTGNIDRKLIKFENDKDLKLFRSKIILNWQLFISKYNIDRDKIKIKNSKIAKLESKLNLNQN